MLDSFISVCRDAVRSNGDNQPAAKTIRAELEALLESKDQLALAHPAPADCEAISGHTEYIFEDETLTVAMVHTPPGMLQPPHDHGMSVVIGGYIGAEVHRLFRRTPSATAPLELSGTTTVGPGDLLSLGTTGVHAIDAAPGSWSSAVHVYLGGLSSVNRSVFHPETFDEQPLTMDLYDQWCRPTPPA